MWSASDLFLGCKMLLFLRILSLYLIKSVDRLAIECNMNMNDFLCSCQYVDKDRGVVD